MSYGYELILDIHGCNTTKFTRKDIRKYVKELCDLIDMQRCKLVFWDDVGVPNEEKQTEEHTKGTTAVQFILTSNITIHTLDMLGKVFVNIFSCKGFDAEAARQYTVDFFQGYVASSNFIERI